MLRVPLPPPFLLPPLPFLPPPPPFILPPPPFLLPLPSQKETHADNALFELLLLPPKRESVEYYSTRASKYEIRQRLITAGF